jgi:hypothetical protein
MHDSWLQLEVQTGIHVVITKIVFFEHRIVKATRQAGCLHVLDLSHTEFSICQRVLNAPPGTHTQRDRI